MITFLTVLHVFVVFLLVVVVLIQSGKGAEVSASFGGSSQTIFGSSGGANFFTKFTAALAAIFMINSLALTILHSKSSKSVFEGVTVPPPAQTQTLPTDASSAPAQQAAVPAQSETQKNAPEAPVQKPTKKSAKK